MTLRKVTTLTATKVNEKKSPTTQLTCFLTDLGVFLLQVDHDCSEKLILLDFSSSRLVAVSVPFPEVQIRKGTESGLGVALLDRRGWTLLSPPAIQFFHSVPANKALITKKPIYNLKRYFC